MAAALATTLRVLEFGRVLDLVAGYSQTTMGAARLRGLLPLLGEPGADQVIDRRLRLHAEAVERLGASSVGLAGARPLAEILLRARAAGSVLEPAELLDVARTTHAARDACGWLAGDPDRWASLAELAAPVPDLEPLRRQIESLVTDDAEIRDDASPLLVRLRRQRRSLRAKVKSRLERLVRDDAYRDALRDALVTERGGRFVVPLRPEHRDRIPGVVHDTSATRQTLYVEPLDLVDDQNRLAEMHGEERAEIVRLLTECTAHVRAAAAGLAAAVDAVGHADALQAVARYASDTGAVAAVATDGELRLRAAFHPLADRPSFVPLDLESPGGIRGIVITGPNTGGKTVALKTIGTLAMMAACGLPVPASEARMPRFARVYADIGDEQSLAANLSTFSGHLANIIAFLADCPPGTLVLLDELGTGTDPAEGAALGIALVERFLEHGATVVVSTHHDALKSFAHRHDKASNAAMEFDIETLQPTYRIRIGRPGRSNALNIASRHGLDPALVGRARELLSSDAVQLDAVIRELESDTAAAAAGREAVRLERLDLDQERARLAASEVERQAEFERLRSEALAAIDTAVRQVRSEGAAQLEQLEASAPGSDRSRQDRRARWGATAGGIGARATARVRAALADPSEPPRSTASRTPADPESPLRRGDRVEVAPYGLRGSMLVDWDPGQPAGALEVDVEGKRMVCRRHQIQPRTAVPPRRQGQGIRTNYRTRDEVKTEVDLHGFTVERALERLDRYLDDALLAGLSSVRLIHGHGTLRLRDAIRDWLSGRPGVLGFADAEPQHGGVGVTIVRLGHRRSG